MIAWGGGRYLPRMFTTPIYRVRAVRALIATLALMLPLTGALRAQDVQAPSDPPIMPGDLIKLDVLGEEDLSGEFLVTQFSTVTLPIIGELETAGHTQLSFKRLVRSELGRSVVSPAIEVIVLKRVRVMGGVLEAGLFNLDPTMSVADALALAGGRTPQADGRRVLLRRAGETIEEDIELGTRLSALTIMSNDEIIVPQRSWWERNLSTVVTGVVGALTVAVALIR